MSFGYATDVGSAVLQELSALRERQEVERRSLVARAVEEGERSQDIADALGMSRSTLWRRYGSLLRRSGARPDTVSD
jgi:transcriptional regulator of acetoin/glycerol metabolism